jgi:hypothetical protein
MDNNEIEEDIKVNDEENENEDSIDEDLMYDDEYESVTQKEILSQISKMELTQSFQRLENKNKKSMNKLKLLLYQKFLNILFSILSQHIRKMIKNLNKLTLEKNVNLKGYKLNNKKYKMPLFYLKSLQKQEERNKKKELIKQHHEDFKKKKKEEKIKKNKEKTETEIEYEKYREKTRLEKINKEEREKYRMDLIKKETYALRLYKYFISRRFFNILKINLEIRSVTNLFLVNIHKKMVKMNILKKMKITAKIKKETELKKEELAFSNALNFYHQKLKRRLLYYLFKFAIISHQVEVFVIQKINKIEKKRYLKIIQNFIIKEKKDDINKINEITKLRLFNIKKKLFYLLVSLNKQKKEEILKEDIMANLRAKARALLGDFN